MRTTAIIKYLFGARIVTNDEAKLIDKCCPLCHSDCHYEGDFLGHQFTCLNCGTVTIVQAYHSKETALRMIYGKPNPSEAGSYRNARGILS